MEHIFQTEYGITVRKTDSWDNKETFTDGTYLYFFLPSSGEGAVDMEQATLAYYLQERQYEQTALPIPKQDGGWYVTIAGRQCLVMRVNTPARDAIQKMGSTLACFHQASEGYSFMPQEISSYGQWGNLWTNKLTMFEQHAEKAAQQYPSDFYRLVMDILPYVIGRSENAIQYMKETESDPRYHQGDRGVIGFRRFSADAFTPVIWPHELVYDHPCRDIAEYLRTSFLYSSNDRECREFLEDYQSVRRLSVFGMRMLYARLIFPADLFDCLEEGLAAKEEKLFPFRQLEYLVEKQEMYERKLAGLFRILGIDEEQLQIPVLHWL
ncbi:hypothetical protein ACFSMW_00235 [Virgibacillus halophilus]|uniref:Spore coat protein YutH n=1 Tax=Tigheibacillus halophilus TaxID=361280 RepID=A0ABU5C3L9_9BACI|nr:hypothetical protein [Virgibacillus halophilus]